MQIISYSSCYRPENVCSLINEPESCTDSQWWHIESGCLVANSPYSLQKIASLPREILTGHYNYCSKFIWPLMHGQPELSTYDVSWHNCYRSLNLTVAAYLNWGPDLRAPLVNDYHFALLPWYLTTTKVGESVYFWQIPWPPEFPPDSIEHICEIARGLLRSNTIGFVSQRYLSNFRQFIEQYLPEYQVTDDSSVERSNGSPKLLVVCLSGNWSATGSRKTENGNISPNMEEHQKTSPERAETVERWWQQLRRVKSCA